MAPSKTKPPHKSSPVAPSAAVGQPNTRAKRSRRPQPKAATTQLGPVVSGEEFDLQAIDDDETSDTSGPPNPSPEQNSPEQNPPEQNADASNLPFNTAALDLLHFFTGIRPKPNKNLKDGEPPPQPPPKICKLCSEKYGTNKSTVPDNVPNFIYSPNTGNSNLRRHLCLVHPDEYDSVVSKNKWAYRLSSEWSKVTTHGAHKGHDRGVPPFSPEAFLEHLIRFIVADDQSIRVVECPEFRQLCLLLHRSLADADIPHRDKMREAIIAQSDNSFELLKSELSKSCGQISFTSDIWSNANLQSYLALTAHWISSDESSQRLKLNAALIGFHRLEKAHTGANIAQAILHLLERASVIDKIGHFTLDNAENNMVAMKELQSLLDKHKAGIAVKFDHLNHRVRCYAHIINICSSHIIQSLASTKKYRSGLKALDADGMIHADSDSESDDDDTDCGRNIDELELGNCYDDRNDVKLKQWFAGIKQNPLGRARRVIRLLRSSDQRRTGFRDFIEDGNSRSWFFVKDDNGSRKQAKVPKLQPLRDVKTRWDSVYMMLERLRTLRPAIDLYFDTHLGEYSEWKLSDLDWEILEGLEAVLEVPRSCQQSMSSESTPVLAGAISSFEELMTDWERYGEKCQVLRPWTEIGLKSAKKYYTRMDDTNAYVVTMFLNPAVRFSWIKGEWEDHYIKQARNTIITLMHQHRNNLSPASEATTTATHVRPTPVAVATPAPTRFKVQRSAYNKNPTGGAPTVEAEFQKYASGSNSSAGTDIVRFWEANRTEFPTLFSIAMDYLPIQATSVPCERVFSSAKDTDTAKRNRISPVLMEALQMLKFSFKKERLNFTNGWLTPEDVVNEVSMETDGLRSLVVNDSDAALGTPLNSFR